MPIVLLNPAAPIHLYSFRVHTSPAKVRGFGVEPREFEPLTCVVQRQRSPEESL